MNLSGAAATGAVNLTAPAPINDDSPVDYSVRRTSSEEAGDFGNDGESVSETVRPPLTGETQQAPTDQDILNLLRIATNIEEVGDRNANWHSARDQRQRPSLLPYSSELESNRVDSAVASSGRNAVSVHTRRSTMQRRLHRRTAKPAVRPVCVSYCACPKSGRELACKCGEEDNVFEWSWDPAAKSEACELSDNNRTVLFHTNYSSGTAAVRGTQLMLHGQYFWEIKMNSPVYGTDMMVGLGTENVRLDAYKHSFTSMLGKDRESWGLSYYGRLQQKGQFIPIPGGKFSQGSIVGVHADMWRGILTFYINRKPIAEKCFGLQGKTVYPMVSSTAARTSMKIIKACSFKTSLQFLCCQTLRRTIPCNLDVLAAMELPPGLRAFLANNLHWLFRPSELGSSSLNGSVRKRRHDREEYGTSETLNSLSKRSRSAAYFDESDTSSSSCSDDDAEEAALSSQQALSLFQRHVASDAEQERLSEDDL